jgi:pimeloyl-ACP methyl ester carboxylesterase
MPPRRRSLLYIAGGALCLSAGIASGYAVQPPATQIPGTGALASTTCTSVGLVDDNVSAAAPLISPATGLPNRMYSWRQQDIRYQVAGDISSPNAVILVHGLFVNADHWRKQIKELAAAGCRVYAVDLLGSGYSSKPCPWDETVNQLVNGENGRFYDDELSIQQGADKKRVLRSPSIVEDIQLGTRRASVDLRHPLGSFYNFYTWSEQICDFTRDVVLASNTGAEEATLVGNSKGTLVSLQAATDSPDLFNGVFLINPTFREQHSAETPKFMMPLINAFQSWLRNHGHGLFDKVAKSDIIKNILKEPYAVTSAVDDQLVDALLTPLLSPGAKNVVFDMLSYTGGPLIEQQLQDAAFPKSMPVSIAYGTADPWLPVARTNALANLPTVDKIIPLPGLGHCPHDESEAIVNPLLLEFVESVKSGEARAEKEQDAVTSPSPAELQQKRVKIWNRKLSPAFVR